MTMELTPSCISNSYISAFVRNNFTVTQTIKVIPAVDTEHIVGGCFIESTQFPTTSIQEHSEAFAIMLASEDVLGRDWNDPEEDEVWADL